MTQTKNLYVLILLVLLVASPLVAGFKTTVTAAKNFKDGVDRIAVVTTECDEVVGCSKIEEKAQAEITRLGVGFTVVPEHQVREYLFSRGLTRYGPELRGELAVEFELDAILELKIPFAVKGDGFAGRRSSEATVEMVLVRPGGEILLHGVGTGRPNNVVTSPERVAGNVIEKLFEKAFR